MKKLNIFKSSVVMLLMFILTCAPEPVDESYQPVVLNQSNALLTLINNERALRGLTPLIPEELLTSICEEKCDDMIISKSVNHDNFSNRFVKSNAIKLLENVGYGFSTDSAIFHAYMKSPGHKGNILSENLTHIGVHTKQKYNCCLFARYY